MSSRCHLVFVLACGGLVACARHDAAAPDAGGAPDGTPGADAARDGAPDAPPDAPPPCVFDMPLPPPASVLWPAQLSATGAATLGGHGHDDGHGGAGFCAGTPVAGQPYYRLVAAGLEVDYDIDNSGSNADDAIPPTFWRDPATFDGFGESGGRVAVYIDVVDEQGVVLNVTSNPEITVTREIKDGPVDTFPLTSKPANEFQTNFPIIGGGERYAFSITGASDKVENLRLPNNHHLSYQLVFRREATP